MTFYYHSSDILQAESLMARNTSRFKFENEEKKSVFLDAELLEG